MYDIVWNVVKDSFQLFFDFLSTAELKTGVTFWDIVLVFFIGGGIITTAFRTFGSSGLASSASSGYDSYMGKVKAEKKAKAKAEAKAARAKAKAQNSNNTK